MNFESKLIFDRMGDASKFEALDYLIDQLTDRVKALENANVKQQILDNKMLEVLLTRINARFEPLEEIAAEYQAELLQDALEGPDFDPAKWLANHREVKHYVNGEGLTPAQVATLNEYAKAKLIKAIPVDDDVPEDPNRIYFYENGHLTDESLKRIAKGKPAPEVEKGLINHYIDKLQSLNASTMGNNDPDKLKIQFAIQHAIDELKAEIA